MRGRSMISATGGEAFSDVDTCMKIYVKSLVQWLYEQVDIEYDRVILILTWTTNKGPRELSPSAIQGICIFILDQQHFMYNFTLLKLDIKYVANYGGDVVSFTTTSVH